MMKMKFGILGLTMFAAACGSPAVQEPLESGLPAWDGRQIVCDQDVSFSSQSTEALPEFVPNERLGFCERAMRYTELHRQYGDQTSYFGVAAASTATLAATYAPLVRRAYSGSTWEFMENLSGDMETTISAETESLGRSNFISRLTNAGPDTAGLISKEQQAVQVELDLFKADDPEGYAQMIEDVNGTFNPTNRLLIAAINRNPFFKAYEAGLAQVRSRHGGAIDYADIEQRIEIGLVLQAMIEAIPPAP